MFGDDARIIEKNARSSDYETYKHKVIEAYGGGVPYIIMFNTSVGWRPRNVTFLRKDRNHRAQDLNLGFPTLSPGLCLVWKLAYWGEDTFFFLPLYQWQNYLCSDLWKIKTVQWCHLGDWLWHFSSFSIINKVAGFQVELDICPPDHVGKCLCIGFFFKKQSFADNFECLVGITATLSQAFFFFLTAFYSLRTNNS